MEVNISVMFSEEEITSRIREMGEQISRDYMGEPIKLVCVLKGASVFACELAKRISVPVFFDFVSVSSYGNGTISSGEVKLKKDLDDPIEGENVLIVEDIVDTGRTLDALKKLLLNRGAKSVKICTLLSKPSRRVVDVEVDYIGYTIPDAFVVGYGLDYAQKYRNLPYIGEVK